MVIAVLLIVALLKTAISTQEKFITVPESQVAAHLITQLRATCITPPKWSLSARTM